MGRLSQVNVSQWSDISTCGVLVQRADAIKIQLEPRVLV